MLEDWMALASCQDIDEPEKFFDQYLQDDHTMLEVNNLCMSCPVKIPCVNYGVYTKSTGVWGGRWLQNGKLIKRVEQILNEYFWRD